MSTTFALESGVNDAETVAVSPRPRRNSKTARANRSKTTRTKKSRAPRRDHPEPVEADGPEPETHREPDANIENMVVRMAQRAEATPLPRRNDETDSDAVDAAPDLAAASDDAMDVPAMSAGPSLETSGRTSGLTLALPDLEHLDDSILVIRIRHNSENGEYALTVQREMETGRVSSEVTHKVIEASQLPPVTRIERIEQAIQQEEQRDLRAEASRTTSVARAVRQVEVAKNVLETLKASQRNLVSAWLGRGVLHAASDRLNAAKLEVERAFHAQYRDQREAQKMRLNRLRRELQELKALQAVNAVAADSLKAEHPAPSSAEPVAVAGPEWRKSDEAGGEKGAAKDSGSV